MKRMAALLIAFCCGMGLCGCRSAEGEALELAANMTGIVTKVFDGSCLMESGGSMYSISLEAKHNGSYNAVQVGDEIVVYYDGLIAESYPAQINGVYAITLKNPAASAEQWGIALSVKDVTPRGLTLICTQSGGKPSGELQTGSYYVVEVLTDGEWKKAAWLPQEHQVAWTTEAWLIGKESVSEWKVDWEWLYGDLGAGTYRIGKEFHDFREAGDFDLLMAYAEFTVSSSQQ